MLAAAKTERYQKIAMGKRQLILSRTALVSALLWHCRACRGQMPNVPWKRRTIPSKHLHDSPPRPRVELVQSGVFTASGAATVSGGLLRLSRLFEP